MDESQPLVPLQPIQTTTIVINRHVLDQHLAPEPVPENTALAKDDSKAKKPRQK